MKLFKTMLLALLMISITVGIVFAGSNALTQKQLKHFKPLKVNEGRKLKSLGTSMLNDVHLATTVKYFDIKQYDGDNRYKTGWSFDMTAYEKLSKSDQKKIRLARRIKPHDSFWKIYFLDGPEAGYYNLHYLGSDSKVHTITSRKKLLSFLGSIDTPTELSILLLGRAEGKTRYKK